MRLPTLRSSLRPTPGTLVGRANVGDVGAGHGLARGRWQRGREEPVGTQPPAHAEPAPGQTHLHASSYTRKPPTPSRPAAGGSVPCTRARPGGTPRPAARRPPGAPRSCAPSAGVEGGREPRGADEGLSGASARALRAGGQAKECSGLAPRPAPPLCAVRLPATHHVGVREDGAVRVWPRRRERRPDQRLVAPLGRRVGFGGGVSRRGMGAGCRGVAWVEGLSATQEKLKAAPLTAGLGGAPRCAWPPEPHPAPTCRAATARPPRLRAP
jgi:hypothetical protein